MGIVYGGHRNCIFQLIQDVSFRHVSVLVTILIFVLSLLRKQTFPETVTYGLCRVVFVSAFSFDRLDLPRTCH